MIERASIFAVLLLALGSVFAQHEHRRSNQQHGQTKKGPNVLVIMTDDQDLLLDSMSVMPQVKSLIGDQGVTYEKHYCTVAWCCPSRVNFFTGRAAHNTNVTSLGPPYGGWPKFNDVGLNSDYLPVWLQSAGINTYYVGKFMNSFTVDNLATPEPPAGWTNSSFLVDPWTYDYLHSHYTNKVNAKNSITDVSAFNGIHTTKVTWQKALSMLDQAAAEPEPFFMMVAPVAPHNQLGPGNLTGYPPIPNEYKGVFNNRIAPRTTNFNPDVPSGNSWVKNLPKLNNTQVMEGDITFFHRLGNLAYVDDMVASLISKLDDYDLLDNTYVIYTTDNGFHIGNHRLLPGKRCPYEEDINIPLYMRGPNVAKGVTSQMVHSHTDLAPTILQMLDVPLRSNFDGAPMAYTAAELNPSTSNKTELVNVEFWSGSTSAKTAGPGNYYNNTYKTLRLLSNDNSFMYTTWCTNEHEFYDMNIDSQQMQNRLATPPQGPNVSYYGRPEAQLFSRLDALLMVTKSCVGDSCRNPWSVLFPDGQVSNLAGAMKSTYDSFFAKQPKVSFSACELGYIVADEGPQNVIPFANNGTHRVEISRRASELSEEEFFGWEPKHYNPHEMVRAKDYDF